MAQGTYFPPAAAVIFDMDGLIVDSEPFWRRAETTVFSELGADISTYLGNGFTMGLRVEEAVALLAGAAGIVVIDEPGLCRRIVQAVVDAIDHEAVLLPGVEEALALCAARGLVVALASGSTPPVIDAVLARFGLTTAFPVVCSAADDAFGKPHPAIFLRAAEQLGVAPASCVVIEDSLNGCIAAKAARMRVIAIPHPGDAADVRFSIADLRLHSLRELAGDAVDALLGLEGVRR